MNLKKLALYGGAIAVNLITTPLFSQDREVDEVRYFSGAYENSESGYVSIYQKDGQKGKTRFYTIDAIDYDLNEIVSTQTELSKNAYAISSAVGEGNFAIAFGDLREGAVFVRSFDESGEMTGEIKLETMNDVSRTIDYHYSVARVYKAKDGFVILSGIMKGAMSKYSFEMIKVDKDMNEEWRQRVGDEKLRVYHNDIITDEDGNVIISYLQGKGMKKDNYEQFVMKIDNDGKVVFNEKYGEGIYNVAGKIKVFKDEVILFGQYSDKGSRPDGIFLKSYNDKGDLVKDVKYNWASKISPKISASIKREDENIKDSPQFIINDVIRTEAGFKIITETVKLSPSIGGSASVGGGGGGASITVNTAFRFGSFVILEIDERLALRGVQVVKNKSNKIVVAGVATSVTQLRGLLEAYKMSNFKYVTEDEGDMKLVFIQRDGLFGKLSLCAATISSDEKFMENELPEDALGDIGKINYFDALPNKDGNKITFYYVQDKQLVFSILEM